MRTTFGLPVLLLSAVIVLGPAGVRAQPPAGQYGPDYAPMDPQLPLPNASFRPDRGGLYVFGEAVFMHQTRHLDAQPIAFRGFITTDNTIRPTLDTFIPAGTRIGSFDVALRANELSPESYEPGFTIGVGWKFQSGVALDLTWLYLDTVKYAGGATFATPFFQGRQDLSDTFLFAPVFNFPSDYSGPDFKVLNGDPGATGIWNGASVMQTLFEQNFQEWNVNMRIPLFQNDDVRMYALTGPRFSWFWERYSWRTIDIPQDPLAAVPDTPSERDWAIYTNIVSNRLYGVHCGCGTDYRLGDTPVGTFALTCEVQGAAFVDIVREREKYELGDRSTNAHITRNQYTFAPEVQGSIGLWWYPPIEGVQLRVTYEGMAFFNTISAPNPVSFDLQKLDNTWDHQFLRVLNGFRAGLSISF